MSMKFDTRNSRLLNINSLHEVTILNNLRVASLLKND